MSELKSIRENNHTTISVLSADIGYDGAYISRVENSVHSPSKDYVRDFMVYFGIMKEHPEYVRFVNEQKDIAIKEVEDKFINDMVIYTQEPAEIEIL